MSSCFSTLHARTSVCVVEIIGGQLTGRQLNNKIHTRTRVCVYIKKEPSARQPSAKSPQKGDRVTFPWYFRVIYNTTPLPLRTVVGQFFAERKNAKKTVQRRP